MYLCGTSRPSSRGPKWAECATPGPIPHGTVPERPPGAQCSTEDAHVPEPPTTQTINHPLPTHTVAMLWGSCSSQSPSQRSGGSCWDPPGLPRFSREVAGHSDSRWTSQKGCPCSQPLSLPLSSSTAGGKPPQLEIQPLFQVEMRQGVSFPSDAGEITGPCNLPRSPVLNVSKTLSLRHEERA